MKFLVDGWLLKTRSKDGVIPIILWWELRRVVYNFFLLCFGVAGMIFLMLMISLNEPRDAQSSDNDFVPFFAMVLVPIAANVCYLAGWCVEIIVCFAPGEQNRKLGPRLWLAGTVFSAIVCFLPGLLHATLFLAHSLFQSI